MRPIEYVKNIRMILFKFWIKGGVDECDTSALIYQCAMEKAPDILSDVVNREELSHMVN
jgi:hypothetical protein